MTTAYTPLLGLALPVTGELSGQWGVTVNDSITSLLDSAISGTTTLSSDVDVTLTTTQGAANTSREAIILWTAGGTVTRTITVPAQSKIYTVINKTSSTQSIKIVGAGPTTGVTIIAGESAVVAWNGVDFIKISNISGAGVFSSITNTGLTSGRVVYSTTGGLETDSANLTFNGTTLTANTLNLTNQLTTAYGGTGLTSYTAGDLPYYATGTALSKLGIGTNGQILTSSGTAPQWSTLSGVAVTTFSAGTTGLTPNSATSGAVTLAGTLATTNGGTGLTSFTANGLVYASSTSALATGSALKWDLTTLTATGSGSAGEVAIRTGDTASNTSYLTFGTTNYNRAQISVSGSALTEGYMAFTTFTGGSGAEAMRLTSTGLGIGTSSPGAKLDVAGTSAKLANNTSADVTVLIGPDTPNASRSGRIGFITSSTAKNWYVANSWNVTGALEFTQTTAGGGSTMSGTPSMLLNSSGNLGLGVTPSAWSLATLQIGFGGWLGTSAAADMRANAYYDGANKFIGSGYGLLYQQNIGSGSHIWQTSTASGTAGNAITFTQAMTLDASGNLGVGTTTPKMELQAESSGGVQSVSSSEIALRYNAYYSDADRYIQASNKASSIVLDSDANIRFYNTNTASSSANSQITGWGERARIDSAGTFQITQTLQGNDVSTGAELLLTTSTAANDRLNINFSMNGVANRARAAIGAVALDGSGGYNLGLAFYTRNAANGTALATTDERMRLDSAGNLGIGTTSPAAKLEIGGTNPTINIGATNSASGAALSYNTSGNYFSINAVTQGVGYRNIVIANDGGNLLVGTTSQIFSGKFCISSPLDSTNSIALQNTSTQASGQSFMYMANSAGNKAGSIDHSGTTTVAYTTSSDYRLKENVQPMTGALAKVQALNPVTYTWKEDGTSSQGFIAHELQAVVPECVVGEKDAVDADGKPQYQGIDTSFLVATLTAAIQEQQAIIESLKARLDAANL